MPLIEFFETSIEKISGGSALFESEAQIDRYFDVISKDYGRFEADQKTGGGRDLRARNNQFCSLFRFSWGK